MPKKSAPPPPLEVTPVVSRSRRQASKEALKQMQILLEDENDAVEIASDEDVSLILLFQKLKCRGNSFDILFK